MATNAEVKAFIQLLGGLAVAECNRRIAAGKGFPLPSVCIAQSALETGWGTAGLMTRANAFFGIKAGGSWTGKIYTGDTWEVVDGERHNTVANFRAYDNLEDSVRDYFDLIGNNSRYSKSLSYGTDKSKWKTPYECIHAIWSGGYATDDVYVPQIMNMINGRNLTDYDALVTGEGTAPDSGQPDITFTDTVNSSDLVQGEIEMVGNRLQIKSDYELALSLDLNRAITVPYTATYILTPNVSDSIQVYIQSGDTISYAGNMANLSTLELSLLAGDKIVFTIDVGDIVTPEEFGGFELKIENKQFTWPSGDEVYSSGIAHFIRVK